MAPILPIGRTACATIGEWRTPGVRATMPPADTGTFVKGTTVPIQEHLTLRSTYLYLVCLIALLISVFAAVGVVRNTVELIYPDPGYYGYPAKEPGLSVDEQRRQEDLARDSQRHQAVLGLVASGTMLLIAVPLYGYHWRRVQSERPDRSPGQEAPPAQ
jgi:hypothetical protein